nr:hypothetical protein [uncultured Hyphomonas sp.]
MVGWNFVLPPNRPSELNIALLLQTISLLPQKRKACILGSTPEYRQVLRNGFDFVTIVDKSQEFCDLSTSIVGSSKNETIVIGDWLEVLGDYPRQFDLIVSHYTHGNIPFPQRKKFFDLLAGSLNQDGLLFDCVFQPKRALCDLKYIELYFSRALPNIRWANDMNCLAIFQGEHIAEHGVIDTSAAYEWLQAGRFSSHVENVIALAKLVTPPGLIWHYSLDQTPAHLGYMDALDVLVSFPEPADSVFSGSVQHLTCRSRN